MRRKFSMMLFVIVTMVASLVVSCRMPDVTPVTPEPTATPVATATPAQSEQTVFCGSNVLFTLPERRWMAYVVHPHTGKESLEQSLRQLKQYEVPAPFTPDLLDHYQVIRTVCFKNWAEIFKLADQLSLGGASRKLDDPYLVTERDQRRAVLKVFFKDDWEIAETMFPLKRDK